MKRGMISLVVALPLILLSIESAVASHFLYTAQDPVRTGSTPPKIDFVFHYWGRSIDSLRWWVDPALRTEVVEAHDNRLNAVPELTWLEVAQQADADIVIVPGECLNPLTGTVSQNGIYNSWAAWRIDVSGRGQPELDAG